MMKRFALASFICLAAVGCEPVPAGTIAPTTQTISVSWDSNTTVANGTVPAGILPWAQGTVVGCHYYTGGTASPSFTAQVAIGVSGTFTAVTGCNAMSVSSTTPATATATANNTFVAGNALEVIISGVSGTPNTALIQIDIQTTAN